MGNNKVKESASQITSEEIYRLAASSGYSFDSVKNYHESFMYDCPGGKLYRFGIDI